MAEILTGGEAGVSLQEWGERVTIRGNFFWSDIANPVTNVPISYTPAVCVSESDDLHVDHASNGKILAWRALAERSFPPNGGCPEVCDFPANIF